MDCDFLTTHFGHINIYYHIQLFVGNVKSETTIFLLKPLFLGISHHFSIKTKKIRIHDLRHSHASLLNEMGFSPLLISERLGQENVETTLQTYSHLYPNKHSEVADRLQIMKSVTLNETTDL